MSKKLYSVRCEKTFEIFVMAEDKADAEKLALKHADEEGQNLDRDWDISSPFVIESIDQVPREWKGSIPWGEEEDRTVTSILSGEKEPE